MRRSRLFNRERSGPSLSSISSGSVAPSPCSGTSNNSQQQQTHQQKESNNSKKSSGAQGGGGGSFTSSAKDKSNESSVSLFLRCCVCTQSSLLLLLMPLSLSLCQHADSGSFRIPRISIETPRVFLTFFLLFIRKCIWINFFF